MPRLIEVSKLLRDLIRIDTVNPPGNERDAADYLYEIFKEFGLNVEILEFYQKRANVIARIKGNNPGKKLLLLGHLDVVPVQDPGKWKVPPFEGVFRNGCIWGRGALDMKGPLSIEISSFLSFHEDDMDFDGEVIFAATADEEMGGEKGIGSILENDPSKIVSDYVINEGGGYPLNVDGSLMYVVSVLEKGFQWLKLRVYGDGKHGALRCSKNPIELMVPILNRIKKIKLRRKITKLEEYGIKEIISARKGFLNGLLKRIPVDLLLKLLEKFSNGYDKEFIRPLLRDSCSINILRGGFKENVTPDFCEAVIDFRVSPENEKHVLDVVECVLKRCKVDYDIGVIKSGRPTSSPIDNDLWNSIKITLKKLYGAKPIPLSILATTDSRYLRPMGSIAYGFIPLGKDFETFKYMKTIHGPNERTPLKSLRDGEKILVGVIKNLMGIRNHKSDSS
ncbi:MAG: M20/M25/M40 family metallo-hydrolase [Candidatus Asgardarchaeia archaeon]